MTTVFGYSRLVWIVDPGRNNRSLTFVFSHFGCSRSEAQGFHSAGQCPNGSFRIADPSGRCRYAAVGFGGGSAGAGLIQTRFLSVVLLYRFEGRRGVLLFQAEGEVVVAELGSEHPVGSVGVELECQRSNVFALGIELEGLSLTDVVFRPF